MTIRKGEPWGEPATVPAEGLQTAPDDRGASRQIELRAQAAQPLVPIGLERGDMARTMGGGSPGRLDGTHMRAVVDLLHVTADGREHWALAHVVARRRWWRGEVVLVMNAEFLGPYDVVPRSHPNDGRVDVVRVHPTMSLRARLQARRRARTGTHLPHPHLTLQSTATWHATFDRPLRLFIDGQPVGDARDLRVDVVADALVVHA